MNFHARTVDDNDADEEYFAQPKPAYLQSVRHERRRRYCADVRPAAH